MADLSWGEADLVDVLWGGGLIWVELSLEEKGDHVVHTCTIWRGGGGGGGGISMLL